ncbi:alpha/beta hydrolase [Spirosoma endbachense]|uniref:Alpha/beta hydrolase n=2 Tax=Spirosoma endbachense TaxID=2666025 RepID=A0A6P1WCC3_9BACT|nr:alpha/beta hydrolase [Spirosoma endbachense]
MFSGCVTTRVVTDPDCGTPNNVSYTHQTATSYFWGLKQSTDITPPCDPRFNHLNGVTVYSTFGQFLLSTVTLGIVNKRRVEWCCSPYTPALASIGDEEEEKRFTIVPVFYGTDRNVTGNGADLGYGNSRAELTYGICQVSVPITHKIGQIETPAWWKLEFSPNPDKHIVLRETKSLSNSSFYLGLKERLRTSTTKSAFIFVHGYNVNFEAAAKRTAQIYYDLHFDGPPVFYSWPSQGSVAGYPVDESNIEWSTTNIKNFISDFLAKTDAQSIYLIAHSMGNRALTRAVASLMKEQPASTSRIKEIILAAPDIDADVFIRDIAPALTTYKKPITLYVSSVDEALLASKQFHGYPRAGNSGDKLVVLPGVETIDATRAKTDFLGHSYFDSMSRDLFELIKNGLRPEKRNLFKITRQNKIYWELRE